LAAELVVAVQYCTVYCILREGQYCTPFTVQQSTVLYCAERPSERLN
jgi:hypothetical protein